MRLSAGAGSRRRSPSSDTLWSKEGILLMPSYGGRQDASAASNLANGKFLHAVFPLDLKRALNGTLLSRDTYTPSHEPTERGPVASVGCLPYLTFERRP